MQNNELDETNLEMLSFESFKSKVLNDFKIAMISRETSLFGRKEVLTGKGKFGIFGDGIELPQVAMARYFKKGDFRAGYYRDQTFMFATEMSTVEAFFAQLYADNENDPFSGGRQMNAHFASPNIDEKGDWLDLVNQMNITSDVSPTAAQMPRALGLAFASNCFKTSKHPELFKHLSNGKEICFCTIGDASTSEGNFWETINAAAVLQVPLAVFIWDNGFGISVPTKFQTAKGSISKALKGLEIDPNEKLNNGIKIYNVKGWDYAALNETFEKGLQEVRLTSVPAIFHIEELTQPQGHSTSGSHERYKTHERILWEKEWDCIAKFKEWIIENNIATENELNDIAESVRLFVKNARDNAWGKYKNKFKIELEKIKEIFQECQLQNSPVSLEFFNELMDEKELNRKNILHNISNILMHEIGNPNILPLKLYYQQYIKKEDTHFSENLYFEGKEKDMIHINPIIPAYPPEAKSINGYEILNIYFNELFTKNPFVYAFGEDVGQIGDVNQGLSGLQTLHGTDRIFDVGIREQTIIGQALGMAYRGLRPIAEIQYLDYLLYCIQTLGDDVASTHFRTDGKQCCPLIVRTRGHRLEGMWHSGSPLGMIINALNGIRVCVPRNMVQAIGMYNVLLKGNDPAILIECLNGYRQKEILPDNLLDIIVPLGHPEILTTGNDITIVSYGSTLKIISSAIKRAEKLNIFCELIDVQTLIPFDVNHTIVESLKKTSKILFIDEDVPSGGTAFMFKKVIEEQGGFKYLDAAPKTLSAKEHRPCYGDDGDYFSKPNEEEILENIIELFKE